MREAAARVTFAAYTDESAITAERFRSVCAVSVPRALEAPLSQEIAQCLSSSDVAEFKWKDLSSAKRRFCALKMIDVVLGHLGGDRLRVDVLVWDTADARHTIVNRDDAANLERMFFHLLRTSMSRREAADWHVFPDERLGTDWDTLRDCLASVGAWVRRYDYPLLRDAHAEQLFRIRELTPVQSHVTPLVQVADLFAGMAAFSRKYEAVFKQWTEATDPQQQLFAQPEAPQLSNSLRERFKVIPELAAKCRARRLGVSLRSEGYLITKDPVQPLNFWHYAPQHERDRAPTRTLAP